MALRDPRNKSRNNASKRTTSATRSKRAASSAKYNPKPSSAAQRSGKKGSGASKVTTGKGGKISSPRLKQALDSVKTKRTPAKTPPRPKATTKVSTPVKTKPAGSTPRGAQGPRTAPQQGPSQRVSGLQGSRTTPKPTNTPPKAATPNVSRVGAQIKQAQAVKQANPGRAARAARRGGKQSGAVKGMLATGLVAAAASGALRNPISKAKAKAAVDKGNKNAGKYNTRDADGTVRSRLRVGPKIVGPKTVGPKTVGSAEQAFDKAYAAAKKAGKKTFAFDGKKYTTK